MAFLRMAVRVRRLPPAVRPRQNADPPSDSSATQTTASGTSNQAAMVVVASILVVFIVVLALWFWRFLRRRRGQRHSYAKPIDGDDAAASSSTRRSTRMRQAASRVEADPSPQTPCAAASAGVDRHTSVRSVMTLPAYRQRAANTEQVLGREGERDGIDLVVEMPTAEEEEALRDDEMEALYQIRRARRQQMADREARREERRTARERNDAIALEAVRRRGRDAAGDSAARLDALRLRHERTRLSRQRAVSSVSYGDLGVARADGTRLRASSNESERMVLLSDSASIAASHRSASSVLSTDSAATAPRSPVMLGAEDGAAAAVPPPPPPPGYDEVSLDDMPPAHTRARAASAVSAYPVPPPDYSPGPGAPVLPALSLESLPQIVIELSSTR